MFKTYYFCSHQNALLSGVRINPQEGYWREPGVNPYNSKDKRNSKRSRRGMDPTETNTFEELGLNAAKLKETLEHLKNPTGKKDNPSRNCRDLMACSPGIKDGMNLSLIHI